MFNCLNHLTLNNNMNILALLFSIKNFKNCNIFKQVLMVNQLADYPVFIICDGLKIFALN